MIRRMLTAMLVAATITTGIAPAVQAGDRHHERHGWHDGRHHYHGERHDYRGDRYHRRDYYRGGYDRGHRHKKSRDYSDEILIGAGIVGLAIVAGSMIASQPREPEINWSDAPRREPNCETDEVYRYLPDGSIQYGDRTRCY